MFGMLALWALLAFPQMALGLSGFELSLANAPLVRGRPNDDPDRPLGRIRNTRKVLLTAALIMGVFLVGSVLVVERLVAPETARWAASKVARARSVSCLDAAISAAPASTIRRKLSASSQSCRWAAVVRSAVRADGPWGFMVTTVPPPRPRRVSTSPAVRRAAIASRRVARETSSRSASSRSGGSALPNG